MYTAPFPQGDHAFLHLPHRFYLFYQLFQFLKLLCPSDAQDSWFLLSIGRCSFAFPSHFSVSIWKSHSSPSLVPVSSLNLRVHTQRRCFCAPCQPFGYLYVCVYTGSHKRGVSSGESGFFKSAISLSSYTEIGLSPFQVLSHLNSAVTSVL